MKKVLILKAGCRLSLSMTKILVGVLAHRQILVIINGQAPATRLSIIIPTGAFVKEAAGLSTLCPEAAPMLTLTLNYRYADTSGTEVNFDADYGLFRGTGRSYQPNNYYDNRQQLFYTALSIETIHANRHRYPDAAKLDVEQKLGKGKLGYGGKNIFRYNKKYF